ATLGEFAFGYSALQAIEIPASITVIPTEAFSSCRELKAVTLHEGLVTIGESAFADTAFTSITLPNTLTTIGNAAFDYAALTSISLPASVKSIGESAFENCKALASVTLNQGLLTIGNCAFQNDKALVEIVIPASVTGINESAFYGCENLAKVKFEGNGPANYDSDAERDHYGYEEYIVYYHQGATGFFTVFDECRYEVAIW
ncbi:MAG: leucine-rich repeat domain-containing protein, partial [Clostridia bacterium]|nr:leucine-rich repeat domain-containing protein [Clostridia bacterium]